MKCWKCGQELPEDQKFCGNCGAPRDRKQTGPRPPFSGKALLVVLIAAAVVLAAVLGIGLSKNTPKTNTPASQAPVKKTDWIALLRQEIYSEDSALTRAMSEAVTMKLVSEDENGITVEVTAPDVSDAAIAWFLNVSEEEYTDQALEATLLELLKGEASPATFQLLFDAEGMPYCTDEFLDACSGGVRTFYTALTAMLIEEMEAEFHE